MSLILNCQQELIQISAGIKKKTSETVQKRSCHFLVVRWKIFSKLEHYRSLLNCLRNIPSHRQSFWESLLSPSDVKGSPQEMLCYSDVDICCSPDLCSFLKSAPPRNSMMRWSQKAGGWGEIFVSLTHLSVPSLYLAPPPPPSAHSNSDSPNYTRAEKIHVAIPSWHSYSRPHFNSLTLFLFLKKNQM